MKRLIAIGLSVLMLVGFTTDVVAMSDADKKEYLEWVKKNRGEATALAVDAAGCWGRATGQGTGNAKMNALNKCISRCQSKTCKIKDVNGKSDFITKMIEAEQKKAEAAAKKIEEAARKAEAERLKIEEEQRKKTLGPKIKEAVKAVLAKSSEIEQDLDYMHGNINRATWGGIANFLLEAETKRVLLEDALHHLSSLTKSAYGTCTATADKEEKQLIEPKGRLSEKIAKGFMVDGYPRISQHNDITYIRIGGHETWEATGGGIELYDQETEIITYIGVLFGELGPGTIFKDGSIIGKKIAIRNTVGRDIELKIRTKSGGKLSPVSYLIIPRGFGGGSKSVDPRGVACWVKESFVHYPGLEHAHDLIKKHDSRYSDLANRGLSVLFNKSTDGNAWRSLNQAIKEAKKIIPFQLITEYPVQVLELDRKVGENDDGDKYQAALTYKNLPKGLSVKKVEIDKLADAIRKSSKSSIVLFVSDRAINRQVTSRESIDSEYKIADETVPNPEYRKKDMDYRDAKEMFDWYNTQQAQCNAANCIITCCLWCTKMCKKFKEWQGIYREARRDLYNAKEYIKRPVYTSYEFRKTVVKIGKTAKVSVLAFDKNGTLTNESESTVDEHKMFSILYGIQPQDRYLNRHKASADSEEDATVYEKDRLWIPILQAMADTKSTNTQTGIRVEEVVATLKSLETDQEKLRDDQVAKADDTGLGDKRFASVVIVLHPNGGLGTGFYVSKNIVLTNYHVVEGSKFVEIGLSDGSDSFGKVIAKDIVLDLALIKVEKPGPSLSFYSGEHLKIGSTVDVIGHPAGLYFSLTRGTISGVRKFPGLYDPGGNLITFIQSDAAINKGNSGGPLLLGDEVVGVNDWKLADTEIEGLAFSIHYLEVKEFLKRNGF